MNFVKQQQKIEYSVKIFSKLEKNVKTLLSKKKLKKPGKWQIIPTVWFLPIWKNLQQYNLMMAYIQYKNDQVEQKKRHFSEYGVFWIFLRQRSEKIEKNSVIYLKNLSIEIPTY